jgi:hypothetical protein
VYSKQSAKGDSECSVTGEIGKQIKTVAVHVGQILPERLARRLSQPITIDQGCENKFVKKSAESPFDCEVEIEQKIFPRTFRFPVAVEASIAVDRAGRNGGEEKKVSKKFGSRQRLIRPS